MCLHGCCSSCSGTVPLTLLCVFLVCSQTIPSSLPRYANVPGIVFLTTLITFGTEQHSLGPMMQQLPKCCCMLLLHHSRGSWPPALRSWASTYLQPHAMVDFGSPSCRRTSNVRHAAFVRWCVLMSPVHCPAAGGFPNQGIPPECQQPRQHLLGYSQRPVEPCPHNLQGEFSAQGHILRTAACADERMAQGAC